MILTCDQCQARYSIDEAKLGPVRTVRCSNCGHSWRQEAEDGASQPTPLEVSSSDDDSPIGAEPGSEPAPAEEIRVMRSFSRPAPVKAVGESALRKTALRILPLAAPAILLVAALFYGRDKFVALWPPAARLYETLGMPAALTAPGLVVRSVAVKAGLENGHRILIVDGEVANIGAAPHPVGALRAKLMHDGAVEARWSFDPGATSIDPGQAVKFHTVAPNPSDAVDAVSVGLWP